MFLDNLHYPVISHMYVNLLWCQVIVIVYIYMKTCIFVEKL